MSQHKNKNVKPYIGDGVDIVMPTHGEIDFLRESLPALEVAAASVHATFYIGDTRTPNQELRESVQALVLEHNQFLYPVAEGYLGGCNALARKGTGKYILITTPDVTLEPSAIAIMKQTLDAYEDVGIVCPLLVFANNTRHGPAGKVQHAGMESNIGGEMIHIFLGWNANNPKVQAERRCLACTGACFMIRRQDWTRVKGFDPMYGLGTYEDMDLCMAIHSIGKNIYYQPQAVGHHYVGASALYSQTGYEFPLQRNRILFAQKWQKTPWTDWNVW